MIRILISLLFAFQLSLAHADITTDLAAGTLTDAEAVEAAINAGETMSSIYQALRAHGVSVDQSISLMVTAAPTQVVAITTAAVTAAPTEAAAITTAAINASPTDANAITTAAVNSAPADQQDAVAQAAVDAGSANTALAAVTTALTTLDVTVPTPTSGA